MQIKCKYDELLPIAKIKPNPRNVNEHPSIQLEGLKTTLKENKIRHPLIISKRSGLLVAGHARLQVMKDLGLKKVPVVYQDFESEKKEFQFMVSDNESQRTAWFNPVKFSDSIKKLKIGKINYKAMGIYDSIITISDKKDMDTSDRAVDDSDDLDNLENLNCSGQEKESEKTDKDKILTCPKCDHKFFKY